MTDVNKDLRELSTERIAEGKRLHDLLDLAIDTDDDEMQRRWRLALQLWLGAALQDGLLEECLRLREAQAAHANLTRVRRAPEDEQLAELLPATDRYVTALRGIGLRDD